MHEKIACNAGFMSQPWFDSVLNMRQSTGEVSSNKWLPYINDPCYKVDIHPLCNTYLFYKLLLYYITQFRALQNEILSV